MLESMGITKAALEMCEKYDLVEVDLEKRTAVDEMQPPVAETVALGCYSFPVESSAGARSSSDPMPASSSGLAKSAVVSHVASAEASLWQEVDEQRMTAIRSSLTALQAAGGDPRTETQLLRRLNALVQKQKATQSPGAVFWRSEQMKRDNEQAALRKETLRRRQAIEDQRIKFQEEGMALAKAKESRLYDTKKQREKEKTLEVAKREAKEKQKENDAHEFHMSMRLASDGLRYIRNFYADREDNKALLVKHINDFVDRQKKLKKSPLHLSAQSSPLFFTTPLNMFSDVTLKKGKSRQATLYCSESFRSELFKDGGQFNQRDPNPEVHLQNTIKKYLPGYLTVLPTEYHFSALVRHGRNCLDLAFLNAVWRYAERCDPKYFPCQIIRGFVSASSGKPLYIVQSNALKKLTLSLAAPKPAKRKKEAGESEKPKKQRGARLSVAPSSIM